MLTPVWHAFDGYNPVQAPYSAVYEASYMGLSPFVDGQMHGSTTILSGQRVKTRGKQAISAWTPHILTGQRVENVPHMLVRRAGRQFSDDQHAHLTWSARVFTWFERRNRPFGVRNVPFLTHRTLFSTCFHAHKRHHERFWACLCHFLMTNDPRKTHLSVKMSSRSLISTCFESFWACFESFSRVCSGQIDVLSRFRPAPHPKTMVRAYGLLSSSAKGNGPRWPGAIRSICHQGRPSAQGKIGSGAGPILHTRDESAKGTPGPGASVHVDAHRWRQTCR